MTKLSGGNDESMSVVFNGFLLIVVPLPQFVFVWFGSKSFT